MKKILASLLVTLSLFIAFSCEEEDTADYPFTIVVKTLQDSIPVNNVRVHVSVPRRGSVVTFQGFTNENGEVSFEYDRNAIFEIVATKGEQDNPSYIGCNQVRLEPNEVVRQIVYIQKFNPEVPGC